MSVYRVYWSAPSHMVNQFDPDVVYVPVPHAKDFGDAEMSEALKFCAELRQDKNNSFVTLSAEDPNCTSLVGVSAPAANYDWTKRRGGRK